jgi:hypothetical protein
MCFGRSSLAGSAYRRPRLIKSSRHLVLGGATVGAVAAFVLGAAACGNGSPSPTTSSRSPTTFVSEHYRYSMALTPGSAMSSAQAHKAWSGSTPFPSDPAFDQIFDRKNFSSYMVAAKRLPPGWSLRRWAAFTISITVPPCSFEKGTMTRSTLGGEPALAYELKCAEGVFRQLAAVHDRRGYLFIDVPPNAGDQRAFDIARRSFHFDGK